jgi:hypothetical protein
MYSTIVNSGQNNLQAERDVLCASSEGAYKSYTMIKKSSLRRSEQIPNWFIAHAPLPFFHGAKAKPQLELCALLQIAF